MGVLRLMLVVMMDVVLIIRLWTVRVTVMISVLVAWVVLSNMCMLMIILSSRGINGNKFLRIMSIGR